MAKVKITCQHCKTIFEVYPSRIKTAKFCGVSCRAEHQKNGTMRTCETCGQEFYATPSGIKFTGARFCSNKCKDLANRKRVDRVCEECGKEFWIIASSAARDGYGRFCSRECYISYRAKNAPRGTDYKFFMQVKHICEICGAEFWAKRYRKNARFCSNKCRGKWHSVAVSGDNNGNWHGGKSFEPYTMEFNETFKRHIRERDGHACVICHLLGKCVHHIDYDKENTTDQNCIVVCRRCHPVVGVNRDYWKKTLGQLSAARQAAR